MGKSLYAVGPLFSCPSKEYLDTDISVILRYIERIDLKMRNEVRNKVSISYRNTSFQTTLYVSSGNAPDTYSQPEQILDTSNASLIFRKKYFGRE